MPVICKAAWSVTFFYSSSPLEILHMAELQNKIELKGFNLIRSPTACSLGPRPSDAQAAQGFSMLQPYMCKPWLCLSLDINYYEKHS